MNLDVGCGWNYRGDVNVDLFLHRDIAGRKAEQERYRNHKAYDKQVIPNLVCADCHHLPFRDSLFKTVYCSHLLEHKGVDASQTCRELLRVANGKLELSVPNLLCLSFQAEMHDKSFHSEMFHQLFNQFPRQVHHGRHEWRHVHLPLLLRKIIYKVEWLLKFFPCPFPTEITCEVYLH